MSPPRALERSPWLWLGAIVLLAAGLRLPTLGDQSFWFDESATRVVVDGSFGHMLHGVNDLEGSPPLFYVVTWLWAQVFGVGETSLRCVSAIAGIALVPVVFAAVRRLAGDRAALIAALLVATSPFLVWFSQEARDYSLMVLLVALTVALAVRFDATGDPRAYHGAAACSVLAVATHYFAAFLVVPVAVWLWRHERRPAGPARWSMAVLPLAGIALLPLALHQADRAKAATVGSFGRRVAQLPKQLLVGYHSPHDAVWTALSAALVLVALGLGLTRLTAPLRARLLWCLGLGAAAVVPLIVLAVIGSDYLNTRNAIAAVAVLCAAVAIATAQTRRAGPAIAGGLASVGVTVVLVVASNASAQRDDWRDALGRLGPATQLRAIVTGDQSILPMEVYRPGARPDGGPAVLVEEIDVLGFAQRGTGETPEPPRPSTGPGPPGFTRVATRRTRQYTLQRYRAPKAIPILVSSLRGMSLTGGAQVYWERGR